MGWKCPICLKDFGRDKKSQQEHLEKEHRGIGAEIEKTLSKMTQPCREKNLINNKNHDPAGPD